MMRRGRQTAAHHSTIPGRGKGVMDPEKQRIKDVVQEVMRDVLREEMSSFWVEREKHYRHHLFIDEMIESSKNVKFTVIKTMTNSVLIAALTMIVIGVATWVMRNIKP
jgi:hypothetical protein